MSIESLGIGNELFANTWEYYANKASEKEIKVSGAPLSHERFIKCVPKRKEN